jgi:peptide/nickel transport system permease protein
MNPFAKFVLRRLALGVAILLVVSILVFLATQAIPGNAAVAKLGRTATPEALAAFRARYHLDRSLPVQYVTWLGDLVRGNLGVSLETSEPVGDLIGSHIGDSLLLLLVASVIGIPIAIGIAILSAMRRDSAFDHASSIVTLALAGLPDFVIAIGLTVLLATNVLHLLPAASLINTNESIWKQLNLVLLPAFTLAAVVAPYIARVLRASMVEVLESDYVAMARLKGVRERRVIVRHALVNAWGPTLQAIALTLAYLMGSVVVVETVFQYPGIGLALDNAITNRDLPTIQALVLVIATFYVLVTIIADLLTTLVTPRLRTQLR